jgi:hypothetical protein
MINLMVEVVLTDQTIEEVEIEEMVETVVVPMVVQIEEENN